MSDNPELTPLAGMEPMEAETEILQAVVAADGSSTTMVERMEPEITEEQAELD